MLLFSKDIKQNENNIGNKALNLKYLINASFLVPDFLSIKSIFLDDILENSKKRKILLEKIKTTFKKDRYIVRSSALNEDLSNSSMAGQFCSEIDLDFDELDNAIVKVLTIGKKKLNGDLSKFSIIIQEYIQADFSGVTFSRNPNIGREMVIEYSKGEADNIVSGKINPYKISLYHFEKKKILNLDIVGEFLKIEKLFNFPVDIEWSIKNNKLYLLQVRNITTISKEKYQEMLFIDKELKNNKNFYYEKNELSEVCPRPVNFTTSLLKKIYSKDGPINNFYKKNKITYIEKDILKIVGNESYIDKEEELNTLFPSLTYLNSKNYKITFKNIKNIFITFKNFIYLLFIKENKFLLEEKIKEDVVIMIKNKSLTLEKNILNFLKFYEYIFEINFFASKSFKKLNLVLKNEQIKFSEIILLSNKNIFDVNLAEINIDKSLFIGNSIDISDESAFKTSIISTVSNKKVISWWKTLKKYKKAYLKPIISDALYYEHLREIGRLLTVSNISIIRQNLFNISTEKNLKEKKIIYFSDLDEILSGVIKEKILRTRKEFYEFYNKYILPNKLTFFYKEEKVSKYIGVSPGKVKGLLIEKKDIKKNNKNNILYVQMLTPDLVEHFNFLGGIVSETGGILSHAGIMAREFGIPVVSNFNIKITNISLGDNIEINGTIGEIKKCN